MASDHFVGFDQVGDSFTALFKMDVNAVYDFCSVIIKYPDIVISNIFQFILMKNGFNVVGTYTDGMNFADPKKTEELVFAIGKGKALRINCSRYKDLHIQNSVEQITEHSVDLDEMFHLSVPYVNVFYSEEEKQPIRKLKYNDYVLSESGLETLFADASIILNQIQ